MRDKRPVDQLSIEELERVLAIRKREARQKQLRRMKKEGRVVTPQATPSPRPQVDLPPELANAVDPAEKHLNGSVPSQPVATRPPHNGAPAFEITQEEVDPVLRRRKEEAERTWRRFVNGALLIVEAAAVIGLMVLAVMLLGARDELRDVTEREQQSANATRMASVPTLEATAVLRVDINDWVLPGGHTFLENGQPVQNTQELDVAGIPAHLLPRVQEQLFKPQLSRPPRTPETAIAVSIPRLGLDETIVQGTDWEALKEGVGQVQNGASPADATGNVVLAAHNDIYGQLFRYLDQMAVGDEFNIRTETGIYTYRVTGWDIVEPTQVEVMDNSGIPTATLISCYPYGVNDKRYIVFAERVG